MCKRERERESEHVVRVCVCVDDIPIYPVTQHYSSTYPCQSAAATLHCVPVQCMDRVGHG